MVKSQIERIHDTIAQVKTSKGDERKAWAALFAAQMDAYLESTEPHRTRPLRQWELPLRACHTKGMNNLQCAEFLGWGKVKNGKRDTTLVRVRLYYLKLGANVPGLPDDQFDALVRARREG
jgi:hypothetical protein